jgi:hypothetical protein
MFDVLISPPQAMPPPPETAPADLIDELDSVLVQRDRVEAKAALLLARAAETGAFERDGYTSLTALLKHRMSLHPGEALRLVARANGLCHAPLVSQDYSNGRLSGAQVDVLLETRSMAPDAFAVAEADLIQLARRTPLVRDLKKFLEYWLETVDREELAYQRHLVRESRSLTLRRDGEMIRINGWVDIETGERLRATLEPGPAPDGDSRSAPARRADLLIDIISGASGRPDILVHVSAQTLLDDRDGISETGSGTFLARDEVDRLLCDANLTRVVFGQDSQPLDVGRTKRLVTPALRAAVVARDLRCVFPVCDRVAGWCDVHHIVPWARDGGETEIDNLVLLCRHHHVLVHEGGWKVKDQPGSLRFLRPDGTELGADPAPRGPYGSPVFSPMSPVTLQPGDLMDLIKTVPRLRGP